MISWNDCDVRFAGHQERVARVELANHRVSSSTPVRQRGMLATAAAILAGAQMRAGAALIVAGQRLGGDKRVAQVG